LDVRLDLERFDDVLDELTELVAEQPYREGLHARLLRALAGAGRTADALAAYGRVHRLFVDDLGIHPDKNSATWPASSGAASPVRRRHDRPCRCRPTGRVELIGTIVDELRADGDHPPVALPVGPGGIGKTTAALAAAQELGGAFPDGQLFLDLRGSHDPLNPHEALGRLLRMLGVTGAALPDDPNERLGLYRSRLAAARLLIVLDDAATERQVRPLLPQRTGCGAVLTSRRQLGALIGPVRLPVPVLTRQDAISLLARITSPTRTDAEPTAADQVVSLCGHLPLAVRVAGARLAVHPEWTVADLADLGGRGAGRARAGRPGT
jgi:Bacterial transcriptional activator domain/NB-ARC domain